MFNFKSFSLRHEQSTLKIGTDSVLLAAAIPIEDVTAVLDIGCGCGVIAFCLANRLLQSFTSPIRITGVDIDADSIAEALTNADLFPHQDTNIKFDFQQIDIQKYAALSSTSYDLIVSNPPFFVNSLKPDDKKKNTSKHRDTTLPFDDLCAAAANLLSEKGKFYVIIPETEITDFEDSAKKYFCICEIIRVKPLPFKPVNRVILGFSKQPLPIQESELSIRDENREYSEKYKQITKLFYLKF